MIMSKETVKTYVVEGRNIDILKATDIVATTKEEAVAMYQQLYEDELLVLQDVVFEARIQDEKEMLKN